MSLKADDMLVLVIVNSRVTRAAGAHRVVGELLGEDREGDDEEQIAGRVAGLRRAADVAATPRRWCSGRSPGVAPAGTLSATLKVQEASGARLPPVRVRTPAAKPRLEPAPHGSVGSAPLGARPVSAPRGSIVSSKVIPVAASSRLRLVTVNWSVTVPPGGTGSSVNSLPSDSRPSNPVTVSTAAALPADSPSAKQLAGHVAQRADGAADHVDDDGAGVLGPERRKARRSPRRGR